MTPTPKKFTLVLGWCDGLSDCVPLNLLVGSGARDCRFGWLWKMKGSQRPGRKTKRWASPTLAVGKAWLLKSQEEGLYWDRPQSCLDSGSETCRSMSVPPTYGAAARAD